MSYDILTAVFVKFKPSGNITPCFWVKRSQLFERTFELLDSEDGGTTTFLAQEIFTRSLLLFILVLHTLCLTPLDVSNSLFRSCH